MNSFKGGHTYKGTHMHMSWKRCSIIKETQLDVLPSKTM